MNKLHGFTLLYRGRRCRVYPDFVLKPAAEQPMVQIQFEEAGHTALVDRREIQSPDGNDPFRGGPST